MRGFSCSKPFTEFSTRSLREQSGVVFFLQGIGLLVSKHGGVINASLLVSQLPSTVYLALFSGQWLVSAFQTFLPHLSKCEA